MKDGILIPVGRIYIKTLRLVCYIEEEKVDRLIEYHIKWPCIRNWKNLESPVDLWQWPLGPEEEHLLRLIRLSLKNRSNYLLIPEKGRAFLSIKQGKASLVAQGLSLEESQDWLLEIWKNHKVTENIVPLVLSLFFRKIFETVFSRQCANATVLITRTRGKKPAFCVGNTVGTDNLFI